MRQGTYSAIACLEVRPLTEMTISRDQHMTTSGIGIASLQYPMTTPYLTAHRLQQLHLNETPENTERHHRTSSRLSQEVAVSIGVRNTGRDSETPTRSLHYLGRWFGMLKRGC